MDSMADVVTVREEVDLRFGITRELAKHPLVPVRFVDAAGQEVVGNVWSTRERIASSLGVQAPDLTRRLLKSIMHPAKPVEIGEAPFMDGVSEDFDLGDLPIPRLFPGDAGRYITSAVAVAEYDGKKNLSFHRLMLLDDRRFAIRLVPRHLYTMYRSSIAEGRDLPVAFCIGVCPSVLLAAATSLEYSQDEMEIASALRQSAVGEPVHVARTRGGLAVPAFSEYVLEGRLTSETVEEGPFVDITGTYDKRRVQPVVEIDRVYHTEKPIFQVVLPGGLEHYLLMGLPREPLIFRSVSQAVSNVRGVRLTEGGCCWLHGVVSIAKAKEGDGMNAIMAAFSGHPSMKKVIVVDEDIDIYDDREVEWAVATRFQASRGLLVVENAAGSSLDPSSEGTTSKIGIDATKPIGAEGFDRVPIP